jgi:DNA polymerase, archaea type
MYDPLIFGKNQLERIVAIEPQDESLEVFIEDKDGTIRNEWHKNFYWILSNKPHSMEWKKLKGNSYYNWGKKYTNLKEYNSDKGRLRNRADIYCISEGKEAAMILNGMTYFKGTKVNEVSVLAFDIETTGLVHDDTSMTLLISNTYRKNGVITRKLFSYDEYVDQGAMIDAWCDWVREINPSVMMGHNIFGYDIPYLIYCADQANTSLKLGRDDSSIRIDNWTSKYRVDGSKTLDYSRAHIYGRNIIDTLFLSYKYDFARKYDNYKLKYIVSKEGLEIKDRVFYDGGQIRFKYTDPVEWAKIKEYCIHDSDDALALYDLMIPAYFYLTPSVPKTFQQMLYTASGSQINSFLVRSYLQNGNSIAKTTEAQNFEGAISFGNPGIFKNVLKVDVASLYPSIMLTYNTYDKMKDPDNNFIKMVRYFTDERLKNKKIAKETGDNYYSGLEQAQKIVINSAYGMLGATGLNYNSPHNASLITRKGREILQQAIVWATGKELQLE